MGHKTVLRIPDVIYIEGSTYRGLGGHRDRGQREEGPGQKALMHISNRQPGCLRHTYPSPKQSKSLAVRRYYGSHCKAGERPWAVRQVPQDEAHRNRPNRLTAVSSRIMAPVQAGGGEPESQVAMPVVRKLALEASLISIVVGIPLAFHPWIDDLRPPSAHSIVSGGALPRRIRIPQARLPKTRAAFRPAIIRDRLRGSSARTSGIVHQIRLP